MKKRIWINFKELRAKLRFEDVLTHFKVEIRQKGGQHQGACPLPGHSGNQSGTPFSANLSRGIFQCFGCGAKGNALEFACLMSGVDPRDGDGLRTVALDMQRQLLNPSSPKESSASSGHGEDRGPLPVKVNAPLDFELKRLDQSHPYIAERGLSAVTAAKFGLGVCSQGVLKGRLAIPLHYSDGRIVGYAGRVVDDATISLENPKYTFPTRRERGGVFYEFRKSLFLYNGFRIASPCESLTVVEGFGAVWWLEQCGVLPVVSLMGPDCSDEQAEQLVAKLKPRGRLWIIPNADKSGERLAETLFRKVAPHRFVRWMKLPPSRRPTDLSPDEIEAALTA